AVEIRVEGVHHHHELPRWWAASFGIDDERAIHPLVNVPLERRGVAVIEVAAERLGIKFIGEGLTRVDLTAPYAGHTIHFRRMEPMKMDGMRVRAEVRKLDAYPVAFGAADGWSWHSP